MKPESVRLVAEALERAVQTYGRQHPATAEAIIRAVMQTDEVRGLVEALSWYASKEAYQWADKYHVESGIVEARMAVAFDAGERARKALSQLEASHD